MQLVLRAKLQTLAQSRALVPAGPEEKTTLEPFSMVTPHTGQVSAGKTLMSIYS
jgi:predicted class III extradiol MEMO1 family dioxygenase